MNLVAESISLDLKLLFSKGVPFVDRFILITKKYAYFVIRTLGMNGSNTGNFKGAKIYFPNNFGYVGIQRVIVDNIYLKNLLPENNSFVDIGAHSGEFAFFSKHYLNANYIISVEPFSEIFELLNKNHPENQNYNFAITNRKNVELYISEISTQLNSIHSDKSRHQLKKVKVSSISLNNFVKKYVNEHYNVLKIDTEGSEYEVLSSGNEVLNMFDYLLVEIELSREGYLKIIELLCGGRKFKLIGMGDYKQGQRSVDIVLQRNSIN